MFVGVSVSVGFGVDDRGLCVRAGLFVIDTISLVEMGVFIT